MSSSYQTLVEAVLGHAKETPDKLAVGFKKTRLTYRELSEQMKKAAQLLAEEYKIQAGDKIMLSAVSRPDYVVLLLAIQYLGGVSIPLDKAALEENILSVYRFVEPKLLLTDTRLKNEEVRKVPLQQFYKKVQERYEDSVAAEQQEAVVLEYVPQQPDTVAEILFTTGTTGTPKGVMLTYRSIHAIIQNTWNGTGMQETDVVLLPLPLNHSVGMRVLRTILFIGASVIIQNGFAFPKEIRTNAEQFKCTAFICVPASLELLYRQMGEQFVPTFQNFRYIEIGAGSLSYDMKKKLTGQLPDTEIFNTWGSTETGGAIFLNVTKHPEKLISLGKPIDGIRLKAVNPEGQEVEAKDINTAGRMVLQGEMQMSGYYNLPEETEEALKDGWLYTNDLVYTDEDGYVYMLGRADDIINVGGKKVSPIEVENLATEYEEIRECACIGVKDEILGQVPVLYIVPEKGSVDENALTKYLGGRMEQYKLPQKYLYIDELPRNRMKKLDRKALYQRWETGTQQTMNETIHSLLSRHSVRNFTEERIPKELLEMIIKTGIQAPSGHNLQTWNFTVIQNREKIEELKRTIKEVTDRNKVFFYGMQNPDTVILVSNDRRNENGIQDSACAAENMMVAAQSYGIGSVWINALKTVCDEPEIRELLRGYGIPERHTVWAALCMGYPGEVPKDIARKANVVNWVE